MASQTACTPGCAPSGRPARILAPGWNYVVKSDGSGTNSRVQLQFSDAPTGRSIDFRYELGKTVIG